MRRINLPLGQAEDFAAGCHFLMPQDEKQEERRKWRKSRFHSQGCDKTHPQGASCFSPIRYYSPPSSLARGRRVAKGKCRGHRAAH